MELNLNIFTEIFDVTCYFLRSCLAVYFLFPLIEFAYCIVKLYFKPCVLFRNRVANWVNYAWLSRAILDMVFTLVRVWLFQDCSEGINRQAFIGYTGPKVWSFMSVLNWTHMQYPRCNEKIRQPLDLVRRMSSFNNDCNATLLLQLLSCMLFFFWYLYGSLLYFCGKLSSSSWSEYMRKCTGCL